VVRHDFRDEKFTHIVMDSLDLIVVAVLALVVGAIIEVYITPAIFMN
jgi:uncharacterized membrane protein SpoIIM required for sporulation